MIKTISGRITEITSPGELIVETGGIGYGLTVPKRSRLSVLQQVKLYTYHLIRENEQHLYGFESKSEVEIFNHLIGVNSVGPKLAMSIMSAASTDEIRSAIDQNNIGFFQSLPGVGKKSAAKIIVELKGKLSTGEVVLPTVGSELAEALHGLGYTNSEIQPILKKLPADLADTESQVAWALKEFSN